jgi:hypothetical protein
MAKARKSRPKGKRQAARGATHRKLPAKRKTARKPPPAAAPSNPLDDLITALAEVLALPIEPEWLPAIRANLEVNLRLAALVAEFDLPDESEPAPVFRA